MIISDDQFIAHRINKLTEQLRSLIDILGSQIGVKEESLTVEELCQGLGMRYTQIHTRKNDNGSMDTKDEHAIFESENFEGNCHHCQKHIH